MTAILGDKCWWRCRCNHEDFSEGSKVSSKIINWSNWFLILSKRNSLLQPLSPPISKNVVFRHEFHPSAVLACKKLRVNIFFFFFVETYVKLRKGDFYPPCVSCGNFRPEKTCVKMNIFFFLVLFFSELFKESKDVARLDVGRGVPGAIRLGRARQPRGKRTGRDSE